MAYFGEGYHSTRREINRPQRIEVMDEFYHLATSENQHQYYHTTTITTVPKISLH